MKEIKLYVVKSWADCYASYDSIEECQDHEFRTHLAWTEDRANAAHFTSKNAAKALAKGCAPTAGARVVRVKR